MTLSKRLKDVKDALLGKSTVDDDWIPNNTGSIGETMLGSLSPKSLRSILKASATGYPYDYLTLAEQLEESDEHYRSVLGTRKMAVSGLAFKVESASDNKADAIIAEQVRNILHAPEIPDLLEDLLDGLAKGFSVVQITWGIKDNQYWPISYDWRDPRLFKPDSKDPTILKIDDKTPHGADMNPLDFIVFKPRLKSGLFIRSGLARLVAHSYLYKHLAIKDWNRFLTVYGMPVRIGKYGTNATSKDKSTLRRAVRDIVGDGSAIIPESMQMEFMQSGGSGGKGASAYNEITNFLNKEISKAVLGQTMTSEDGSSQAQAKVHNEVRQDIVKADARRVCGCIVQQLIKPWLILNYGDTKSLPKISLPQEEIEDLNALADNYGKLHNMGVPLSKSQIRDKFDLKEPENDEDTLAVSVMDNSSSTSEQNRQHHNHTQDDIDETDEDTLALELYGSMAGENNPYAEAMQKFAEQHEDLETMKKNMADMAKELNNPARDKMIEQTARGGFVANLNGQLDAQDEK